MTAACTLATLGTLLTYWIGSHYFGLSAIQTLLANLASNVGGFFALLLTLALERRATPRKILMGNAFKTWLVLFVLYVSFTAAMDPVLRDLKVLAALLIPMMWSNGWMLPLWGRAQDRIIRWEHRGSQSPAEGRIQRFARRGRNAIRAQS